MTTLQELIKQRDALAAQQAALEKAMSDLQNEERNQAVAKIRALMAEHGVTIEDLSGGAGAKGKFKAAKSGTDGRSGKPVAAKYRNTATGDSWSGRGLKPRWLTAAIEAGAKLEEFAITPAA